MKLCLLPDTAEKYCKDGQVSNDNTAYAQCLLDT